MEPFCHGNVEPVHENSDDDDREEWLEKRGSLLVDNKEAGIRLYQVGVFQIPLRKVEQTEQPYVSKKPRLRLPNPTLRPKSSPSSSSEASQMPPASMKAKPSPSEASQMPRPVPTPKASPVEVSSTTETSKSQVTSEPKDELEEWIVLEDKPVGQHE